MARIRVLVALASLMVVAGAPSVARASGPPRLVVLVVVDQLTPEHLRRYAPLLSGGLGRIRRQGAYYPNARFAYANTETGPGHATIATGAWPSIHGIVANRWVDPATGDFVACADDSTYGHSPQHLRVPSIADALKLGTRGRGKVVALSLKPRGSVFVAGRRPDAVVWYDAQAGRYVAGQWPGMPPRPPWLTSALLKVGPEHAVRRPWTRFRAEVDYARWAGPDDRPSERNVPGLGRTFPRTLGVPADGWAQTYPSTPPSLDDLMTLARAAVKGAQLGADATPDLLVLSISTFDYVGHIFGPRSQESLDMLLRVDAALGALLDGLDREFGSAEVLTMVTSDHGALPLPEAAAADGVAARRLSSAPFNKVLGARLRAVHAARVYLTRSRATALPRPLAERRRDAQKLMAHPDIVEAYTPEDVGRFTPPFDVFFRRSLSPGRMPDILYRHAPWAYLSSADATGTGHGSPYLYDQTVPVLLSGPGVKPGVRREPVMMTRLAPTIAAALDIAPPPAAYAGPLSAVQP